jgi:enoyl-CoA hydratase/carnithine racemase
MAILRSGCFTGYPDHSHSAHALSASWLNSVALSCWVGAPGGLEIVLACDVIVASERARFADTHAKAGLMPGWGMSAALPTAVGRRKAVELSLTGDFVDAQEALRIGLVNHVVPHDELLDRTYEVAQSIRAHDQAVVRRQVALYRRTNGLAFEDALALEREAADEWREARRS